MVTNGSLAERNILMNLSVYDANTQIKLFINEQKNKTK
jgi:hypothetical protein